ncbi:MAG: phosphopantetheine-binding protein [Oscillospiraceae bacterium]|nr:phosphopantetheine-binding protein [Oscillospiraceae bacterium]
MVLEKLTKLLAAHLDVDQELIQPNTTFESLGIDSLDTVEMIMELEEEMGVELELDEKVTTVGELAAFIEKKMA